MWDEKAKDFPRYDKNDVFVNKILQKIAQMGVDFTAKTVLDIGAGSGRYTLHLAQKARQVYATDISAQMLNTLKTDTKSLGINNIQTSLKDLSHLRCHKAFDIAFVSMTPAVQDRPTLFSLRNYAKSVVYIGWLSRKSFLLGKAFKAHGAEEKPPKGARLVQKTLENLEQIHTNYVFKETFLKTRTKENTAKSIAWHLQMKGISPNFAKIDEILSPYVSQKGLVTEKTRASILVCYWTH